MNGTWSQRWRTGKLLVLQKNILYKYKNKSSALDLSLSKVLHLRGVKIFHSVHMYPFPGVENRTIRL